MTLTLDVSLLLLALSWFDSRLADAAEYCWESFNVTCREDEVILMMTANYGRMKFGRCLPRDYFVGCAADILPYMDRKCSGRRACALDVPDTELHNMQPCPKDLLAYLEATHTCVKVAQASFTQSCRPANQLSIKSTGFLSSIVTSATGQGSSACPWIVTVPSGRRINITLLDFAANVGGHSQTASAFSSSSSSSVCVMYGVLREFVGDTHSEVTVCGGGDRREKPVYLSERNRLVVEIVQSVAQLEKSYFLLRYEAVGCSDLKAPPNGWVERQGDRATVYCNQSSDVWHLVCSADTWIGTYHNCSSGSLAVARDSRAIGSPSYPFGVFVAVTIGIAIGVLSGLLLLSVVICCQRKKRFRLCLSCYAPDDSGIWSHADDLAVNGGDLEKTRVLLAEKFCYDLIGRRRRPGVVSVDRSVLSASEADGTTPPSLLRKAEFCYYDDDDERRRTSAGYSIRTGGQTDPVGGGEAGGGAGAGGGGGGKGGGGCERRTGDKRIFHFGRTAVDACVTYQWNE